MDFNVGDRVIVRNNPDDTEPPEHGVIKMIKPSTDPNSGRQTTVHGVLIDGTAAPESLGELAMVLYWLPKERLIHE
jgi:hypothetical protein